MKKQHGSFFVISFFAALVLCLGSGTAGAQNIAWDMVNSTSQNLVSYSTDAPPFSSPADGFQKYTVDGVMSIPWTLVDDTANGIPADELGIIDAATDSREFFGVVDTENGENSGPVNATWVFDISSAVDNVQFHVDLAAMGNFELEHTSPPDPYDTIGDSFVWSYQVDGGSLQPFLFSDVDEDGAQTYTMADGTTRDLDDPLYVNGTIMSNAFQTFSASVPTGSQLTVVLTATADGGSEGYGVRNLMVTASDEPPPAGGGEPIPALSSIGMVSMALLLMAGGIFLFRRLH